MRSIEEAPDRVQESYAAGQALRAAKAERDAQRTEKRGDPYLLNLEIQRQQILRDNAVADCRKFAVV